jgi:hypothetical protein
MKYLTVFLLLVSSIFVISCAGPKYIIRQNDEVLLKLESCRLQVPNDVTIIVDAPSLRDFDLYGFKYHDKEILRAYFGNHPNLFEGTDKKSPDEEGTINGMKYKALHFTKPDGQKLSQYLIEIPELEKEWWRRPQYAHFWYLDLSPEEEKIATQIIHSLKTLDEK